MMSFQNHKTIYSFVSSKKTLFLIMIIVGYLCGSSGYAWELNNTNISDPLRGNCQFIDNTCDLSFKNITSIASGTFIGYNILDGLILSDNQITSIESGDLNGLSNLYSLNLSNNQITSIESDSFDNLINLDGLILSNNQITSIESGSFDSLTNLRNLFLADNQITFIESGGFNGLTNLVGLSLDNNQISSIQIESFNNLTNLVGLYLANNQISSIESGSFDSLTNLQNLNLDVNQITSIESSYFDSLIGLQDLSLSNNQITSIKSDNFDSLNNLQYLNLSHNQISSIESSSFSNLINLTIFNLSHNQIISIESSYFDSLNNLQYLYLMGNCINIDDIVTTDYLDGLGLFYIDYSLQSVCVNIQYNPSTATIGPVTGSLIFVGPTSYISVLQADNTDLSIYDHISIINEAYVIDYNSIVDNNNYLRNVDNKGNITFPKIITGNVTWIIPGTPTINIPTTGTIITGDLSTSNILSLTGIAEVNTLVIVNIGGTLYTGTSNNSGIYNIVINSPLGIGNHTINVFARDGNGNTSTANTVSVNIVSIPVVITSTGPGGGGGTLLFFKDNCPAGDYSNNDNDGICGTKPTTATGTVVDDITTDDQNNLTPTGISPAEEIQDAYEFARKYNITTMDSLQEAIPYGDLYRRDLAKMISVFAEILDKDTLVNKSHQCNQYSDLAGQTDEMYNYIIQSCKLGLMGLKQDGTVDTSFRPNAKVTRSQLVTILSRLLYGSKYNAAPDTGVAWYEGHVNALKNNKIVTKVDNETLNSRESRVYVWIMFERVYNTMK